MAFTRLDAGRFHRADPLGAGAEHADAELVDQIPQRIRAGPCRVAVVQHHGGAHCQARHQPVPHHPAAGGVRSEEHTSELQSLMRISYAVFCLKKKKKKNKSNNKTRTKKSKDNTESTKQS